MMKFSYSFSGREVMVLKLLARGVAWKAIRQDYRYDIGIKARKVSIAILALKNNHLMPSYISKEETELAESFLKAEG